MQHRDVRRYLIIGCLLSGIFTWSIPGGPVCENTGRRVHLQHETRIDTMDHNDIMQYMDLFLQPHYSIEDAKKIFGEVKDDSRPGWIVLKPKTDALELVQLEYLELQKNTDKEIFLASVFIRYVDIIFVAFSKLGEKYGEPEEIPRLKPDGDIPYRFEVKGNYLQGDLILFVRGRTEKDIRLVHGIKFTRYPPENKQR